MGCTRLIKMVPLTKYKWENFSPYLMLRLTSLDHEEIDYEVVYEEHKEIKIAGSFIEQQQNKDERIAIQDTLDEMVIESRIHDAFCDAISDFFIEELEEDYIKSIIKRDYGFVQPDQIEGIYHYCFDMLFLRENTPFRDEEKIKLRKKQVYAKVYEYLQEKKVFHLDGFIRFRLTEYRLGLEELIEFAIDEYIVDQEYQQFIQLLKLYVSQQMPKVAMIHALHVQERKFILFDAEGKQLTEQEIEQCLNTWAIDSVSHEDIIVSTLIAMAPKTILLHTHQPTSAVVRTLKAIFQGRLEICLTCDRCKKWQKQGMLLPN